MYINSRISKRTPLLSGIAAVLMLAAMMIVGCKQAQGNSSSEENKKPETPVVPNTPAAAEKYAVSFEAATPGGKLTAKVDGAAITSGASVEKGKTVTFTAEPLEGYKVEKWELNGTAVNDAKETYELPVNEKASVKVYFKEKEGASIPKCTVTVSEVSNGKVTVAPALPEDKQVPKGQELTITATAESGYVVDKWSISGGNFESGSGADGSVIAKVKVNDAVTIGVTFKQQVVTPPASGDFVAINPPAAGITGADPAYTLPADRDFFKGVFRTGRKVKLSPYMMGKTEVPYKRWKEVYDWAVKSENGYKFANEGVKGKDGNGSEDEPVTTVSWRDCIVWCNAYTQMKNSSDEQCVYRKSATDTTVLKNATDATACDNAYADMSKKGFRLPTEAEWEYAARWQGSDSTNADKYGEVWLTKLNSASGAKGNWEDAEKTGEVAWYSGNADSKTHPVGTKKANALGLHDMSGNVWEWCWDRYGNIETGDVTDPLGATSGLSRVLRGGSWYDGAKVCVVGDRFSVNPDIRDDILGFRLACRP